MANFKSEKFRSDLFNFSLLGLLLAFFGVLIYLMVPVYKTGKIDSCTFTQDIYYEADFSRTTVGMCTTTDSDGNTITKTCTKTTHWSVPASDVISTKTINGVVSSTSKDLKQVAGYYLSTPPPITKNFDGEMDFRGYSLINRQKFEVAVLYDGSYDTFSEEKHLYSSCLRSLKNNWDVEIKMVFGLPVSLRRSCEER